MKNIENVLIIFGVSLIIFGVIVLLIDAIINGGFEYFVKGFFASVMVMKGLENLK